MFVSYDEDSAGVGVCRDDLGKWGKCGEASAVPVPGNSYRS